MTPEPIIAAERPDSFSRADKEDFIAMVRAGGEVEGQKTLEDNVRDAERLAFARREGCLVGVGAFKKPKLSYRSKVEERSGASVDLEQFPFEFGYLFVLPSARGQGLSFKIWQARIAGHERSGIFATARVQNKEMAAILPRLGFTPTGSPYQLSRENTDSSCLCVGRFNPIPRVERRLRDRSGFSNDYAESGCQPTGESLTPSSWLGRDVEAAFCTKCRSFKRYQAPAGVSSRPSCPQRRLLYRTSNRQ